MSIHYFHCSDGADALFDRRGREVGSDDLERSAVKVARRWMAKLPGFGDWLPWTVYVHDEDGRCVAMVPFPVPGAETEAGSRAKRSRAVPSWRAPPGLQARPGV